MTSIEFFKLFSFVFSFRIIGIVAGYVFTFLVTREYGAKAMGIFALSYTLLQIFSVIGRMGIDIALLRFIVEYSSTNKWGCVGDIYKKALHVILPFSIVLSFLMFGLSHFLSADLFKKENLSFYFRVASFGIVPFVLLLTNAECLRGLGKLKEYMFFQQAGIFVLAVLMLGLVNLRSPDYVDFIKFSIPLLCYIVASYILSIIAFLRCRWLLKPLIPAGRCKEPKGVSYFELLSVSVPMFLSSSLGLLMTWIDTLMLGIFRTEEDVGIYSVAFKISMIVTLVLISVNTIATPRFAEFYSKNDLIGLLRFARNTCKIMTLLALPMLVLVIMFSEQILSLFGEKFVEGQTPLIILSIAQFINVYFGSVIPILNMTGNQVYVQNILLLGSILNIILNTILIPMFGMIGAAFSTAISILFWNVLLGYKVKQFLGGWIVFLPRWRPYFSKWR